MSAAAASRNLTTKEVPAVIRIEAELELSEMTFFTSNLHGFEGKRVKIMIIQRKDDMPEVYVYDGVERVSFPSVMVMRQLIQFVEAHTGKVIA